MNSRFCWSLEIDGKYSKLDLNYVCFSLLPMYCLLMLQTFFLSCLNLISQIILYLLFATHATLLFHSYLIEEMDTLLLNASSIVFRKWASDFMFTSAPAVLWLFLKYIAIWYVIKKISAEKVTIIECNLNSTSKFIMILDFSTDTRPPENCIQPLNAFHDLMTTSTSCVLIYKYTADLANHFQENLTI